MTDSHPAANPLPGLRRVEQIMGTAIGFDVRDASVDPAALEEAFEYLRGVDRQFSPYKADSEVSRLLRAEIAEADCSRALRDVLGLCEQARKISEGYFDIRAHRPDGRPDPTGLVKGWSLEGAGRILEAAGARNTPLAPINMRQNTILSRKHIWVPNPSRGIRPQSRCQ